MIREFEPSGNLLAALLLLARPHLRALGLAQVTAKAVLEATGATRSRAYELVGALRGDLEELVAPVGRPPVSGDDEPNEGRRDALLEVARAGVEYLLARPGAAQRTGTKARYSDCFRDFVVSQCVAHPSLETAAIAEVLGLPAPTVCEWLRNAQADVEHATDDATDADTPSLSPSPSRSSGSASSQLIQTVLAEWRTWCGPSFTTFCEHLRDHCGVPFGRTTITSILALTGERLPRRRPGRSPDEEALRGSFASFFPGAVWVGDGCEVVVELGDQRFDFNLELLVDTHSDAFVGIDVRPHENSDALISAFEEARLTTSTTPLAVLLDNKPCNHAPSVHEATEGTLVIPATKNRPQNKGHVEGAFGLFSQCAPPLRLDGRTDEERARQLVELCTRIFYGALNMRPRAKRGGRSRIELYREAEVKLEQLEQAKVDLQARLDKQLAAQRTRRARLEPHKRAYLDRALEQLELDDPTGHFFAALARYDLDDIADGVAIYRGKAEAETLPESADIRYLLGIVKNVASEREGLAIAKALWDERLAARDHVFDSLVRERGLISSSHDDAGLVCFIDKALEAERELERHFWIDAAAEVLLALPPTRRRAAFERAARRIHTSYRVPHGRRRSTTRALVGMVLPLA